MPAVGGLVGFMDALRIDALHAVVQKDWFRKIEDQTVDDHLGDHKGTRRSPRTTALFIDIVRDLAVGCGLALACKIGRASATRDALLR